MPDVSIAVSAQDNYSTAIKSMSQVTRGFSKDAEDMQKKLDMLNKNKVSLKVEADKARAELKELEKQFAKTGDEADGLKMQLANENFENLRRNLGLVTKGARDVEKAMVSAGSAKSKFDNVAGSSSQNVFSSLAQNVAIAGIGKMMGDLLLNGSKQMFGSFAGEEGGTLLGSALSGMVSGASLGMMTGNALVAAGTALAGTVIGVANGASQNFQKKDDTFKGVTQDVYDGLKQENTAMVESGIAIASERGMDTISYEKLYGGKEMGDAQLKWIKDTANATPFLYEDLKKLDKTLVTYGYTAEESQQRLMQIGDTGAALGMNNQDMAMVATGLGRMKSTDKTTMEYMNLLIERQIDATGYLAEAYGKSKGEIQEDISKGKIKGSEAADIIAELMGRDYAGSMEQMSKTFGGLTSTLQGWEQDIQAAAGKGFMDARTPALERQNEHYSAMGDKYEEAAGISGKLEGVQKGRQERIGREKMNELFFSDAYEYAIAAVEKAEAELDAAMNSGNVKEINTAEDKLAGALAETQRMIDKTEAQIDAVYQDTDMEKSIQDANKGLLGDIRTFLVQDDVWTTWGYNMGIEMGKGMMSVQPENGLVPADPAANHLNEINPLYNGPFNPNFGKKAFGQITVPFDNFPALLHQGERVLTASEARAADGGGSVPPITITGNTFTVREEADIDKIALALAQQLAKARLCYAP